MQSFFPISQNIHWEAISAVDVILSKKYTYNISCSEEFRFLYKSWFLGHNIISRINIPRYRKYKLKKKITGDFFKARVCKHHLKLKHFIEMYKIAKWFSILKIEIFLNLLLLKTSLVSFIYDHSNCRKF